MIRVLFTSLFTLQVLAQVSPPVWAPTFSEKFVESYTYYSGKIMGSVFYDSTKDVERVDRADGRYEVLCGSVLPNVSSPCTHLVNNKKRYIIHPDRRTCCMCCDEAHGCGTTKRDWLSSAKFEAEEGSYLKWSFKGRFLFIQLDQQLTITMKPKAKNEFPRN